LDSVGGIVIANASIVDGDIVNNQPITVTTFANNPRAFAFGIYVDDASKVTGNVINNNTMLVDAFGNGQFAVGIANEGLLSGNINNGSSGNIQVRAGDGGYAYGIGNDYPGVISGNIINDGMIGAVPGVGGKAYGILNNGVIKGGITNNFSIWAQADNGPGGTAYGILNKGTISDGITNNGIIVTYTGAGGTAWAVLNVGNALTINQNAVDQNSGGMYGDVGLSGADTFNINGGTVTGSIIGNQANVGVGDTVNLTGGILALGNINRISNIKSYNQGANGTLQVTVTNSGAPTISAQNIVIGGSLNIVPSGTFVMNHTYSYKDFISASGSLNGSFASVTAPSGYVASVSADGAKALNLSVTEGTVPDAGGAGGAAATVGGTTANGTLTTSNPIVISLPSQTAINKAAAQLSSEVNTGGQQASLNTVSAALSTISTRIDSIRPPSTDSSTGLSSGDPTGLSSGEASSGFGFWTQGFGSLINQGVRNGAAGYNAISGGAVFGSDMRVAQSARIGASFAYANTDVSETGALTGSGEKINSYLGTLYGTYTGAPWYVDGTMTFGYHNYDSTRIVSPTQTAKGSFAGQQYGIAAEFGYPLQVIHAVVTPYASIAYNYLNQDSYTETNAPGANLHVNSSNTDSTRSGLGAKVSTTLGAMDGWTFKPNAHAAWMHEFNDKAPSQISTLAGQGEFTTPGTKLATESGVFGVSMDVLSSQNLTVTAKYDLEVKDQYTGHNFMVQLRDDF